MGSISDIIFEMRFNPNVLSPGRCRLTTYKHNSLIGTHYDTLLVQILGVTFPPGENASSKLQEQLLREAAAFVITHQIPAFVSGSIVNPIGTSYKR